MASQYDTLIQNLGVNGLQDALEVIAAAAQGGTVTQITAGDLRREFKQRGIAPARVTTLLSCFRDAQLFNFDDTTNIVYLTNVLPWGYDDGPQRRTIMLRSLQAVGFLEVEDDTTLLHLNPVALQTDQVDVADEALSDMPHVPAVQPDPTPETDEVQRIVSEFEAALNMTPDVEEQKEQAQAEAPPQMASAHSYEGGRGFGGRGARRVVPMSGEVKSAEELLREAGLQSGEAPANVEEKQSSDSPPPSSRRLPPVEAVQGTPDFESHVDEQPASAPPRKVWGAGQPVRRPTALPPSNTPPDRGGRTTNLRPGAQAEDRPTVSPTTRGVRRPGAEPPASDAPAWAKRRGSASYGQSQSAGDTANAVNADLIRLLLEQQSAKANLNLDIKTLRALAQEINRYIAGLEEADLASDPNLRVELQSLLDQINSRTQQGGDTEDA
jgi:hypothetical protein